MTITVDASHTTVLKLLARGRAPEWVADACNTQASKVEEVGRRYGWPDLAQLRANLDGAGVVDDAPRHPQPPQRGAAPVPMSSSAPRPTPPVASNQNLETSHAGTLELLLARAGKHDTTQINSARNAVLTACTRLEGALQKAEAKHREKQEREAGKAAAKSRIELLERQLREAKALLRGNNPAASKRTVGPAEHRGEDPKVVRAWARDNGVDCPAVGRVPAAVVEAFRASAHAGEKATA